MEARREGRNVWERARKPRVEHETKARKRKRERRVYELQRIQTLTRMCTRSIAPRDEGKRQRKRERRGKEVPSGARRSPRRL